MALPTTIADALEQTALGPKSVFTDKARVEMHDLQSLIAARNDAAAQTAAGKNHLGLRLIKLQSPGGG
jgi:hypothetical protein